MARGLHGPCTDKGRRLLPSGVGNRRGNMLNTILMTVMRNALLVLGLGALVLLNTAMWG